MSHLKRLGGKRLSYQKVLSVVDKQALRTPLNYIHGPESLFTHGFIVSIKLEHIETQLLS